MAKLSDWLASWRLLSWRTAVVVAFVLYTLIGFLVVPRIAERVIVGQSEKRLDRTPTIEKIHANPYTLSMTIEGFSLPDRPGSTLLAFDRLYANAQISSLFRWAATLKELDIEGPYAAGRRFEDGKINLLELLEDIRRLSPPREEPFELPRAVFREIEVSDGRIEIEDRVPAETKLWEWTQLEVMLHDISTLPDREGDDEISLALPEGGQLNMAGTVVVEPFEAEGRIELQGAALDNLWRAVTEKFGFQLARGRLGVDLSYRAEVLEDGLHVALTGGDVRVTELLLEEIASGTELLTLDSAEIVGLTAQWPEERVEAESVIVDGVYAHAWIEPDGTPSWEPWVPEPTREQIVDAYDYVKERVEIDATLGRFEVRDARASFEDRTLPEPERLEVSDVQLVLTDVSSQPESLWGLDASAALRDGAGATASGTVGVLPVAFDAEVALEAYQLPLLRQYAARIAPVDLKAGVLSSSGRARAARGAEGLEGGFTGNLTVEGLEVDETVTGAQLARWGELKVEGIEAELAPMSLAIESVDLYEAGLEVTVAEDGSVNVVRLVDALSETDGATGGEGEARELPPVRVARVELHDCYGRYTNAAIAQPFERRLESINGTITRIANDDGDGAEMEIETVVDSGGLARVAGTIDLFDYRRSAVLEVDVRDVLLPPMSPMSIEFVGHPVDTGRSALESDLEIRDSQLVSTHHLELDNLTLGESVEGEGRLNVPVKLGVSLLKDKDGRITLDVPIEGNLDNPEFIIASAIEGAIAGLIGDVAKAPFRLLARLGGGSEDQNLESIDFALGSAELETAARANLDILTKALEERPEIGLEIEGSIAPAAEIAGLREQALTEALGGEEPDDVSIEVLEQLYAERRSSSDLDGLRQQHVTATEEEETVLDEAAYREALIAALVAEQPVDETALEGLATARAEAIRSFLVDGGVAPERIAVLPETVEKEAEGDRVSCRLAVTAD